MLIPYRPLRMDPQPARMERGLSLIEMMIGLTIGLMLTLGLFTLIANTSQSFKVQDDFSRMQENGATAFRYIGDSLRHAGFYGYSNPALGTVSLLSGSAVATTTDCGGAGNAPATNWAFDFAKPLISFPDLTPVTIINVFPCIKAQNLAWVRRWRTPTRCSSRAARTAIESAMPKL